MSTNEYIRREAQKAGWKKYYMRMRPVGIGTCPKGMMDFINYECRTEINGCRVWAEVYYERDLTPDELENFEMVRA